MRRLLLALVLCGLPMVVVAAPVAYFIDTNETEVGFSYRLAATRGLGVMPIDGADLRLDFKKVSRSKVSVVMNAAGASTGLPFVTNAMKGETVLDTKRFPQIRFVSTSVSGGRTGVVVRGNLTIRGTTRPVDLSARFFRKPDRDPGDLSRLTIQLEGEVSRAAFGAGGFPDLVGDTIKLRILATIDRAQ